MNANRMKYATTPTYGMQKRGAAGKKLHGFERAPEAPDFSKTPEFTGGAFAQPFFSTPTQPAGQPMASFPLQPASAWFPQGMSTPAMRGMPSAYAPSYSGGFAAPQPQPYAVPFAAQPPMAAAPAPLPPMSALAANGQSNPKEAGFSPRAQGFVPPQSQGAPAPQSAAPVFPPVGFSGGMPAQQPPFYGGAPMGSAPVQNAPLQGGVPLPNAAPAPVSLGGDPQNAFYPAQGGAPFAPGPQSAAQQPGVPMQPAYAAGSPVQRPARPPMDADKLWALFLFGLLPLLFIPCVFVPQSLDILRYLFLTLSVCGMGGMWYRQMYSSAARVAISVVYVALCIVAVSMLMQGNRDVRQTVAKVASVQQTVAPETEPLAAAVATESVMATPAPTTQSVSEAQMRLETFMSNWAGNRVEDMVRLVQPSWATAQDTPSNRLFMLLANRTPEEYTIEEISGTDDDTSRTVSMTATINKNNGKDPILYRFMVLMVKEGGEWYVDPNSLATNDEVKTEEVVVNDSKTTGKATAAPRMTVSPAPPASTMLYYNPNGGNFYHLSANCESVKSEYLPLQGTFQYSELGNKPYSALQPCLKCGAPTQTLPPADTAQ